MVSVSKVLGMYWSFYVHLYIGGNRWLKWLTESSFSQKMQKICIFIMDKKESKHTWRITLYIHCVCMGYNILYLFVCTVRWMFMTLFAVIIPILSIIWHEIRFLKTILNVLFFFYYVPTHPLDCRGRIHHFIMTTNANWLAPMPSSSHITDFLKTYDFTVSSNYSYLNIRQNTTTCLIILLMHNIWISISKIHKISYIDSWHTNA